MVNENTLGRVRPLSTSYLNDVLFCASDQHKQLVRAFFHRNLNYLRLGCTHSCVFIDRVSILVCLNCAVLGAGVVLTVRRRYKPVQGRQAAQLICGVIRFTRCEYGKKVTRITSRMN